MAIVRLSTVKLMTPKRKNEVACMLFVAHACNGISDSACNIPQTSKIAHPNVHTVLNVLLHPPQ